MDDYWRSPEALERKRLDRWLRTARAALDREPRQKGRLGRREARPFRDAIREAVAHQSDWPKPRATLALDFDFLAAERQPPGLWRLPKHYLDLLGATSAPLDDPGPVLYQDDRQVKLLFASLRRTRTPDAAGKISVQARTRTSAIADMELAGKLMELGQDVDEDTTWAEADPWEAIHEDYQDLPPSVIPWLQFHDKSRYQAMLLGSNDRLVRGVLFQAARWLLTGVDPDIRRLDRLGLTGRAATEDLVNKIALSQAEKRNLLWSTIRVELPPLPLKHGDGARFDHGVREAFHDFVRERPDLQPLIVPLRVTVLVVPPNRRAANTKDLDNILIEVLAIMEDELKPHGEPWLLAPPISGEELGAETDSRAERLGQQQSVSGSKTWAYQVLELRRGLNDPEEGALVVIPGLGWNRRSIWSEAEQFVEQRLEKIVGR